jgi:hypothetical protein
MKEFSGMLIMFQLAYTGGPWSCLLDEAYHGRNGCNAKKVDSWRHYSLICILVSTTTVKSKLMDFRDLKLRMIAENSLFHTTITVRGSVV